MMQPHASPIRISPFLSLPEFVRQCVETVDTERRELVIRDDLPHIGVMRAAINLGFSLTIAERAGRVRMIVHALAAAALT
jgi:hypothetical protein